MAKKRRRRVPAAETFRQVQAVAASKKIPLVKAFAEVAKSSGRSAGTVKVAYYRVARVQPGAAGTKRRGRPRRAGGAASAAVLARAQAALKELSALVRSQQAEIDRLRGKAARLDDLRRVLDRS